MSDFKDFDQIIAALRQARDETLGILNWVRDPERLIPRVNPAFRPILWHLGHMGAFQEWWLLIKLRGRDPINPRFQLIFDPIQTPREDPDQLPSRAEIESYLERVRIEIERDDVQYDPYIHHLVLEHEYQHQETLAMLMQMLPPEAKERPIKTPTTPPHSFDRVGALGDMVQIPGGIYSIGARRTPFAYDNEEPIHKVEIADFRLDRYPVTNAQFAEFVAHGGYSMPGLWSAEGWKWKVEEGITRPQYWSAGTTVIIQEMFETLEIRPDHPVTGVSWHEAQAYARFAGKRLPTEAEWEVAASPVKDANFDGRYLGTTPVGALAENQTALGCFDMSGNVWEWTSSTFGPYPGFEAYPYPEYSELWFDGDHRVLKGGCWMTRAPLLRLSFRNFYRPGFRYAFSGFRCAAT